MRPALPVLSEHGESPGRISAKPSPLPGCGKFITSWPTGSVHNLNLVNPTHWAGVIYDSLEGWNRLPVVWNSGGYERVETLRAMEGRVQVYLPDLKYVSPDLSAAIFRGAGLF